MDLYGQKSQSIPQKTLIIILALVFLYLYLLDTFSNWRKYIFKLDGVRESFCAGRKKNDYFSVFDNWFPADGIYDDLPS